MLSCAFVVLGILTDGANYYALTNAHVLPNVNSDVAIYVKPAPIKFGRVIANELYEAPHSGYFMDMAVASLDAGVTLQCAQYGGMTGNHRCATQYLPSRMSALLPLLCPRQVVLSASL